MLALGRLLELTLAGREPTEKIQLTQAGARLQWLAEGVLAVTPASGDDKGSDLLLSAAIHGNETAPIELLDRLLQGIAGGRLRPRARLLLMLGNPPAMRRGERYIDQDINRLFNGRHADASGYEALRACELERLAANFFNLPGRSRLHYDMHTAIRGSQIEQFALYPYSPERSHSQHALARLQTAGISAVLLQNKLGITFSSYTYACLDAEAFTLELGKAQPFGQNQGVDLQRLEQHLQQLIEGTEAPLASLELDQLQLFSVAREVIKHSDAFRLYLPADVENFSELPLGYLLAEDIAGTRWVIDEPGARIIFPNPKVKNGLRAGLLVIPVSGN